MVQTFTHPIDVRFRDMDSLGHINNSVYLTYVESCRVRWMQHVGIGESNGLVKLSLILAHASINFRKPATIEDSIFVTTTVTKIGTKSFDMAYEIMSKEQGLIADSKAVLVWWDPYKKVSVNIPDQDRAILTSQLEKGSE